MDAGFGRSSCRSILDSRQEQLSGEVGIDCLMEEHRLGPFGHMSRELRRGEHEIKDCCRDGREDRCPASLRNDALPFPQRPAHRLQQPAAHDQCRQRGIEQRLNDVRLPARDVSQP